MMNIDRLKAELATGHPVTGPYDADDAVAAEQLNAVNRTRDVESVTGQQIFEAVVPAHYNALSADFKQLFLGIIGMGDIPVNGTNTKAALVAMFSGATDTLNALAALQTKQVSRAVEIGLGHVRVGNVMEARE
jgi:hypothetical protein